MQSCSCSFLEKRNSAQLLEMIGMLGDVQICRSSDNTHTQSVTEAERRRAEDMEQTFNGKPGDLIEINRGLYKDWAVYIGENEVVHFTTDGGQSSDSFESLSSSPGKVKLESFADVVGNHRYRINNLLDNSRKPCGPSIIVKKAREMVDRVQPYDLVNYNCQHFATEMRYGKPESRQFNGIPGDLIEINRGSYKHWAVYIGEDEVVHLVNTGGRSSGLSANPSSSTGKVKREKLTDVVGNDSYQVNNLLDNMYEDRKLSVIVEEARAMVDVDLPYNVDTYNCEHFATEMRYGKAVTWQFKGKPGDLIEIFRGSCEHWAVYIGQNKVVNFTTDGGQSSGSLESPSSSTGKVKREKLSDVVGHHRCRVNNLQDEEYQARDPSIIVEEACAMVGRKPQYNVVSYNCQHFAIEMRYGKAESRQFKGNKGDLIQIFLWGYQHWAVYIGKNEVVHVTPEGGLSSGWLANPRSSTGKVKREKLTDVVGNDRCQVNNLLDEEYKARDPSIIVKEACEMVGRKPQYNVVSYNSEHFATEMRYGKAESRQFNGKPGDLIQISRGFYKHWAVYIGENEVVHLVNTGGLSSSSSANQGSSSNGIVKRETFANVVSNNSFQVNNLLDKKNKARDPSIIVKEALEKVDDELPYNVVTYNCEHFATDLRYGKPESRQVTKAAWISGISAGTSAAVGAVGALVIRGSR